MSGPPIIRACPEDFRVEELPLYEPSGEGEHTFVWVEKRGLTSEQVAGWLAREAGVRPRDVGYAGRKDRVAVARQHFSVPGLDPRAAASLARPGVEVLGATPHRHKLRTGQLRGNRFEIRVRDVEAPLVQRALEAAPGLQQRGLPNRFGPQRYGRDGDNVERGRAILAGDLRPRDRREGRFLLSALQAAVFDEVLASRPLPIDRVEVGDLARRTDSGGLFEVEDAERENARAARFEISATGPIFGTRMEQPSGAVRAREDAARQRLGVPAADALVAPRGHRLRGARRPLRVPVGALEVAPEADALRVCFELPAGSYATVLLAELLGVEPVAGGPAAGS